MIFMKRLRRTEEVSNPQLLSEHINFAEDALEIRLAELIKRIEKLEKEVNRDGE